MDAFPLREMHLFAGAGGGILGGLLLGHVPVCAVELEEYPRRVLLQRQRDGILPWFPVWDDVRTFDGHPWRGLVDVICGGFPCQDISSAGKGAGIDGARSGLWSEFARIIGEVGPRFVLVENSPLLTSRGLGRVLGDLAALGFNAEWGVLAAAHAGAVQIRERIWILGHANGNSQSASAIDDETPRVQGISKILPSSTFLRLKRGSKTRSTPKQPKSLECCAVAGGQGWWASEPGVPLLANGVASQMDRLSASGDGQVPAVVELAWQTLQERIVS